MSKDAISGQSPEALLKRAHALKDEAETKELYRDWAASYDETMTSGLGYLSPTTAAKLLTANLENKSDRILDVGAGTGLVGKQLANLGHGVIDGIDYSGEMLEQAAATGVYDRLIEADLSAPLAISDQTYQGLICVGTFTYGHVGAGCLDELFRIMKSGGCFVAAIRKSYWQPAGFAEKIESLTAANVVRTISFDDYSNYIDSTEVESWFPVWQKC